MDEVITEVPAGTITEWNDDEWDKFGSWLKIVLSSNNAEVIFTKKDGTERKMNCTRDLYYIMENQATEKSSAVEPTHKTTKTVEVDKLKDKNTITVFDTDLNQWRSFKLRSVTNVHQLILKYGTN